MKTKTKAAKTSSKPATSSARTKRAICFRFTVAEEKRLRTLTAVHGGSMIATVLYALETAKPTAIKRAHKKALAAAAKKASAA